MADVLVERAGPLASLEGLLGEAVFSRTGGNPFYVTEVLASGAGTVPVTVRDAVLARVARLSRAGQEVAGAASVLGRRAEANRGLLDTQASLAHHREETGPWRFSWTRTPSAGR